MLDKETLNFSKAIEAEPEQLKQAKPFLRYRYSYLDRGRYLDQLYRVCQYYSRQQLHVILFEDLRNDQVTTYQSVCRFLDIDTSFTPTDLGKPTNGYVQIRSVTLRNLTRRLPAELRNGIGKFNTKKEGYPPLDQNLRKELAEHFSPSNLKLQNWLNRDLSNWNY